MTGLWAVPSRKSSRNLSPGMPVHFGSSGSTPAKIMSQHIPRAPKHEKRFQIVIPTSDPAYSMALTTGALLCERKSVHRFRQNWPHA